MRRSLNQRSDGHVRRQDPKEKKYKWNEDQSLFFKYVDDDCQIEINILTEIKEFVKQNNGKRPLIIINLLALSDSSISKHGLLCNNSEDTYNAPILSFFNALQATGVEMLFYRTIERKMSLFRYIERYSIEEKVVKCISDGTDLDEVVVKFGKELPRVGKRNLIKFAKDYGREIFVKYLSDASMEIGSLALKMNALAVISDNRQLIFYEDKFQTWSSRNLNYDTMTTTKTDIPKIKSHFNIPMGKMPLASLFYPQHHIRRDTFVTIFDKIEEHIRDRNISRASLIEKYSEDNLDVFVRDLFSGADSGNFLQLIRQYFNDMRNLDKSVDDSDIKILTKHGTKVYRIIHNEPMHLKVDFYDANRYKPKSYYDMMKPLIQRRDGAVLQHEKDISLVKGRLSTVGTKSLLIFPFYPRFTVPDLSLLLDQENHRELDPERYRILLWIVSNQKWIGHAREIQKIPAAYFLSILSLIFLGNASYCTTDEADTIVMTIADCVAGKSNLNTAYPKRLDPIAFHLSFLFRAIWSEIRNCLRAVGLVDKLSEPYFDGVHFHHLHGKRISMTPDERRLHFKDNYPAEILSFRELYFPVETRSNSRTRQQPTTAWQSKSRQSTHWQTKSRQSTPSEHKANDYEENSWRRK